MLVPCGSWPFGKPCAESVSTLDTWNSSDPGALGFPYRLGLVRRRSKKAKIQGIQRKKDVIDS